MRGASFLRGLEDFFFPWWMFGAWSVVVFGCLGFPGLVSLVCGSWFLILGVLVFASLGDGFWFWLPGLWFSGCFLRPLVEFLGFFFFFFLLRFHVCSLASFAFLLLLELYTLFEAFFIRHDIMIMTRPST